jgi:branched-chain amino acid transport system ATP-binding protein
MILKVTDIHTYYGTSHILFGISLGVDEGEIVCCLGRNGAGKTTVIRSIMGLTPPRSGNIEFSGREITGKPPYRIACLGICWVPEDRRVFSDLTVEENLKVAVRRKGEPDKAWTTEKIWEFFPKLKDLRSHRAGYLSGGEQQMLTIGRTLMTNPQLILLDEPAEGLSPLVVRELGGRIKLLKEQKVTVLLCEQNVSFALGISERAYVIEKGTIAYQGSIEELKRNEEVKRRYLMV